MVTRAVAILAAAPARGGPHRIAVYLASQVNRDGGISRNHIIESCDRHAREQAVRVDFEIGSEFAVCCCEWISTDSSGITFEGFPDSGSICGAACLQWYSYQKDRGAAAS